MELQLRLALLLGRVVLGLDVVRRTRQEENDTKNVEIIGDFERLLEGSRVGGGFQNGQYMHFWLSAQISV